MGESNRYVINMLFTDADDTLEKSRSTKRGVDGGGPPRHGHWVCLVSMAKNND